MSQGCHRVRTTPGVRRLSPRALLAVVRGGGQQSIRSTFTRLLAVPLISLLALWAYVAIGATSSAYAERDANTVNNALNGPTSNLFVQLDLERTDTFTWQSTPGSRTDGPARAALSALDAQRKRSDAAITGFKAAVAADRGAEPPAGQATLAAVVAKLGQLGGIRARVDAGSLPPLAAFQDYNGFFDAGLPMSDGALTSPDATVAFYEGGLGVGELSQSLEYIEREATLVGGALVDGGQLSTAAYELFMTALTQQRFLDQLGQTPVYWQQDRDPYTAFFASATYQRFAVMENDIAAAGAGARLPMSDAAWQASLAQLVPLFLQAQGTASQGLAGGEAHQGNVALLRLVLVGGVGLLAVVLSAALLLRFGARITRELTSLREAARTLAHERLPALVRRLRAGEEVDADAEAAPLALGTRTREVTETASAFSAVQHTAVEAAAGQAQLRKAVNNVFRSLARRNQLLLQRQLRLFDELELRTADPETLGQLFLLDHLTTRMRRQAEGLLILSGAAPSRTWAQPVPIVDVLRAAIGEIEDYTRVDLVSYSEDYMTGTAVADVTHLFAELIENATLYSPPDTRVQVRTAWATDGFVVEIADRGIGFDRVALDACNHQLASPPEFDLADSSRLGLFVVSLLAARTGVAVMLRDSGYGTVATVLVPHQLIVPEEAAARDALPRDVGQFSALGDCGGSAVHNQPHVSAAGGAACPGPVYFYY